MLLSAAEADVHAALITAAPRERLAAPTRKPAPETAAIVLEARPSLLTRLLEERRSSRELTERLSLEDLASLIGGIVDQRGKYRFATLGGLGALRLLCLPTRVSGLNGAAYWVAEDRLALIPAPGQPAAIAHQLRRTAAYLGLQPDRPPSALLMMVADWERIDTAYYGSTLAGSYWDAGAALAHLYLSCTAAGLNGCACAALDNGSLVSQLELDPERFGHVASFAVGGPTPK